MKRKQLASRIQTAILFAVLAWWLLPQDAHGYLDPGTGSYIFQVILAALLGASLMLKVFWARIIGFFRKRFSGSEEASSPSKQGKNTPVPTSESVKPTAVSPGQSAVSEQDDD